MLMLKPTQQPEGVEQFAQLLAQQFAHDILVGVASNPANLRRWYEARMGQVLENPEQWLQRIQDELTLAHLNKWDEINDILNRIS